jgi:hypothetical protein
VIARPPAARLRHVLVSSALASLLALAACAGGPQPAAYEVLDAAANPLKARFNRDVGHVRVVVLAAPT